MSVGLIFGIAVTALLVVFRSKHLCRRPACRERTIGLVMVREQTSRPVMSVLHKAAGMMVAVIAVVEETDA